MVQNGQLLCSNVTVLANSGLHVAVSC